MSASTIATLAHASEPVRVLLWYPAGNAVNAEVRAYFADLASATGKVTIEERNLMVDHELAKQYELQGQRTVVLVRGAGEAERHEKLELAIRPTPIELDAAVSTTLMRLLREKRKAYLTVGHGEINDPDSTYPEGRAAVLKTMLGTWSYEVDELALGAKIPDDAAMVLVLGPRTPLDDSELATLDAYLAGGGNVLIALDPKGEATLGRLETRLGVHFDRTSILDDKNFIAQKGPSWAITNQFSSHASIASLAKAASNEGVLLPDSGSLDEHPFRADPSAPKRTFVIRSMANSFRDLDGNGAFTDATEQRDRYNIAAAIEGTTFRALVFADVDLFVDRRSLKGQQMILETYGGPVVADAIKWVGGEEVLGSRTPLQP